MLDHVTSHHTDPREFIQQDIHRHDDKALKIDLREIYKQDDKLTSTSDRDQTMSRDYVQLKQLGVSEKQLKEAGFPSSETLLKHMVRDNDRAVATPGLAAEATGSPALDSATPPAGGQAAGDLQPPPAGKGKADGRAGAAGAAGAAAEAIAHAAADAPTPSPVPKFTPLDLHNFQPPHAAQDHTRVARPPVPQFEPKHN